MDIRCINCGESWSMDSIHETVDERFHDEVKALAEKYKNHPDRHLYNDPFQKEYVSKYYNVVRDDFRKRGCVALGGGICHTATDEKSKTAALLSAEMMDLFGDDMDAVASTLEDAEFMGLI